MHLLLNVLGIALLAITLPLLAELLILSLAACFPPRRLPRAPSETFRLAVVVPAHNEARLIAPCVHSLLQAATPQTSIFVVAHNCTDATPTLAAAAGAHVLPLNERSGGGKGAALHYGFTHALSLGADAVLVIDADSTVTPNLLTEVAAALAAGSPAVQCRYIAANAAASTRLRLMALALTGMNVLRPRGRSRLGLSCGIFGNGFALTAPTLRAVPYLANSVVEDLEYHLLLLRAGLRVDFLDQPEVRGELPEKSTAAVTQRARWEGGRALLRRRFAPTLALQALTRPRLLEPLLDLLALPLATEAAILLTGLLIPMRWVRFYSADGLAILLLYVLISALLAPDPLANLRSLAYAPLYFLFKLAAIPARRRASRANAAWVRTDRNDPHQPPPPNPILDYHQTVQATAPELAAPARVNLIGEHTDYTGGLVLPMAIPFYTIATVSPSTTGDCKFSSDLFPETRTMSIADRSEGVGNWSDYPVGVLRQLQSRDIHPPPFHLHLRGNVPFGAGLSSSASVEVASALALLHHAHTTLPAAEIATLCKFAENNYVHSPCGIMDQFVITNAKAGHALLLETRSLNFEHIPMNRGDLADTRIVVCNSMVKHSIAGGDYGLRRRELEAGQAVILAAFPHLRDLGDATLDHLQSCEGQMSPESFRRCRHIISENARVRQAREAMIHGDPFTLGKLMLAAHASERDDFECSCAEVDFLVETAANLSGCFGARLTGGGFGGCTVNLVRTNRTETFASNLRAAYQDRFHIDAQTWICEAVDGAMRRNHLTPGEASPA